MPSETELAFVHPEHRAKATAPAGVHDRLSLRDHIVSVEIGAFQAERDLEQRLSFDVVVEVAAPEADLEDDVDRILSYDRITWAIEAELSAQRLNLLETLADRIADRILAEPQAMRVFVRIQKLDKGNGALGVEIVREPGAATEVTEAEYAPVMAWLSEAALKAQNLEAWLTQLQSLDQPLIIALAQAQTGEKTTSERAQLNIDLLAIEQVAWRLAARFPQFTVAGTRTEIDWAFKNKLPAIWAPSKLILDTPDAPESDARAWALWFAKQWRVTRIICFGEGLPNDNTIPFEIVTLDQSEI